MKTQMIESNQIRETVRARCGGFPRARVGTPEEAEDLRQKVLPQMISDQFAGLSRALEELC